MTPEEARRVHVLTLLEGKRSTPVQAVEALGPTPRQVLRLQVGLRRERPAGMGAQEKMRQLQVPSQHGRNLALADDAAEGQQEQKMTRERPRQPETHAA